MATQRRLDIVLALVIVVAVAAGLAYAFRDQIAARMSGSGSGTTAIAPAGPAGAADARGPITIDPRRQQLVGVRTVPVERAAIAPTSRATGTVRYDETRMAEVNLKVEGWIRDLFVDYTGQSVARGQRLFTLFSPELLATENEYLLALRTRDELVAALPAQSEPTPQAAQSRDYADRLVAASRQRLALWDLPEAQIRTLEETRKPQALMTFTSPANGYVIEKQAITGMRVMPGQTLYKIADLSVVWVEADIYEREMSLIRVGQSASVTLDAYPGETFPGRAVYIYPYVEEQSRTVKVRLQFSNARGRLKPGMFANVELQTAGRTGLTVPSDALLDSGAQQVVFVAEGEGRFTPRPVKIGLRLSDRVEILDGLKEGEQVASSATFFLDSESQLRAGLQNYEAPPPPAGAATAPGGPGPALSISFRSQPDPARTGDNTFEARVADASGQAVTDAEVLVQLFMPAMPSMSMPAMRGDAKLPHAGGGVYRGPGQVAMAGRWDVTVTVSRGGARLGSQQFALVAR